MKEKLFYFPFFPADWLADVSVLTLEEKGAYITLISTMYLQEDCSVFKRHIQNILGIQDKRRFDRIMTNVYPLLIDNGEKVTQKRIKAIKSKIQDILVKKSEGGKKAMQKRWSNKPKVYNKPKVVKQGPIPALSAAQRARKMLNDGYE
tara:strand:- start:757 stop:1200 length:444 start_codon:yes stop_codon:yes gene_type:complete